MTSICVDYPAIAVSDDLFLNLMKPPPTQVTYAFVYSLHAHLLFLRTQPPLHTDEYVLFSPRLNFVARICRRIRSENSVTGEGCTAPSTHPSAFLEPSRPRDLASA